MNSSADIVQMIDVSQLDLAPHAREHSPESLASLARDMKINGQLQAQRAAPGDHRRAWIEAAGRTARAGIFRGRIV
jgi:hypothetical protein